MWMLTSLLPILIVCCAMYLLPPSWKKKKNDANPRTVHCEHPCSIQISIAVLLVGDARLDATCRSLSFLGHLFQQVLLLCGVSIIPFSYLPGGPKGAPWWTKMLQHVCFAGAPLVPSHIRFLLLFTLSTQVGGDVRLAELLHKKWV